MRFEMRGVVATVLGVVAAAIGAVGAGCQHGRPPVMEEGASSFRFVEPASAKKRGEATISSGERQPGDMIEPPQPIPPLELPAYPKAAQGRQRIPMAVGLRIVVAADGSVAEIGHSLRALSTPGPWAEAFRAAAEAAVATWRFVPAEIRHLMPKQGGPQKEYWHVTRVEKTEYALDVELTFTASGVVKVEGSDGR